MKLPRELSAACAAALLGCLLAPVASPATSGPTQADLNRAPGTGADSLFPDHDVYGQRYSARKEINATTVGRIQQVCQCTFPEQARARTAPIADHGRLYVRTAHHTVALGGATCKVIWASTWIPMGREPFNSQRSASKNDRKSLRGTSDGYLLALDPASGAVLWSHQIADAAKGYFLSTPPLIVDDLIISGPAGAEWATKGRVVAFRLSDGSPVWSFDTIPNVGAPGADTSGPDLTVLASAGGSLWTALSYDPEKQWIYVHAGGSSAGLL